MLDDNASTLMHTSQSPIAIGPVTINCTTIVDIPYSGNNGRIKPYYLKEKRS